MLIFLFNDDTSYEEVPMWWRNFADQFIESGDDAEDDTEFDAALTVYGGKFIGGIPKIDGSRWTYGKRYVRFIDEESFLVFKLRWS